MKILKKGRIIPMKTDWKTMMYSYISALEYTDKCAEDVEYRKQAKEKLYEIAEYLDALAAEEVEGKK